MSQKSETVIEVLPLTLKLVNPGKRQKERNQSSAELSTSYFANTLAKFHLYGVHRFPPFLSLSLCPCHTISHSSFPLSPFAFTTRSFAIATGGGFYESGNESFAACANHATSFLIISLSWPRSSSPSDCYPR